MAFNPDEYVAKPVSPKESEEESKKKKESTGFDPDAYLASTPEPAPTQPQTQGAQSAGDVAAGIGGVVGEYWKPALEVGGGLLGAKKTFDAINAYKTNSQVNQLNGLMDAYKQANYDYRQYEKELRALGSKDPAATARILEQQAKLDQFRGNLGNQIDDLQRKMPGYKAPSPTAPVNPATAPAAPQPAPTQAAPRVAPAPTAPAQAAGAVAPEVEAAAQAARAPANAVTSGFAQQLQNLSRGGANLLGRMSPYLEAAGRVAAPVARVAGPAGVALSAYEAYPYLQEANIGERTKSGEVKQMVQGANRMALNMPTPAPLSSQEARNLLASGDERTIRIYGGRDKLQQIINTGR